MNFDTALTNAKFSLLTDYESVFIATILLNLNIIEDSSIETACTNGKYIKLNPDFFNDLPLKVRVFVLAHETWHIAFQHGGRNETRNHEKFNRACDYVINLMLKEAGYTLWEHCLCDDKYKDMSAEEVYDLLPNKEENKMGNDIEEMSEDTKQEVTDIIIQAANQAEMQHQVGSVPKSISRMVQEILYPKLPYGDQLDQYFSERDNEDYSWSKRNRRYADVYKPSLYSERMGPIAIYIDTSCSVSDKQFSEYIALMVATKERYKPSKMTIVDFDTELKEIRELTDMDSARDITFTGGGGTAITPVMDHIKGNDALVSIIITDGFVRMPSMENVKNKDIIWLIDNNKDFTSDVGTVIHIN